MLLDASDQETILIVNTLVNDLNSRSVVEQNLALTALAHLAPPEMAAMLLPRLLEKTRHPKDFIRKKALICVETLLHKNPSVFQQDCSRQILACLADKDPGVVAVAVQVSKSVVTLHQGEDGQQQQAYLTAIIPSLLEIQGQILDGKLPPDYKVCNARSAGHGVWAPYFQVDILSLLRLLLQCDPLVTMTRPHLSNIHAVLHRTIETHAGSKAICAQAVFLEAIKLLAVLEDCPVEDSLRDTCFQCAFRYLRSKHHNVIHLGLECLEALLNSSKDFELNSDQEQSIVDCMRSDDRVLQTKAFALLHALAGAGNVTSIVAKSLEYLSKAELDDFRKADMVDKVVALTDRFASELPGGSEWRAKTLLKLLLRCSPLDTQREDILERTKLALTVSSKDDEAERTEKKNVGRKLTTVLGANFSGGDSKEGKEEVPEAVTRLYIWCLANFKDAQDEGEQQLTETICNLALTKQKSKAVLTSSLEAVFSLLPSLGDSPMPESVSNFLRECSRSNNLTISDLASEILALLPHVKTISELDEDGQGGDATLSCLDHIVVDALKKRDLNPYAIKRFELMPQGNVGQSGIGDVKFAPYRQLDKESLARISDPVSPQDLEPVGVPQKWTAAGRVKEEEQEGQQHGAAASSAKQSPTAVKQVRVFLLLLFIQVYPYSPLNAFF